MTQAALDITDELFFSRGNFELSKLTRQLDDSLVGLEDGELFLQYGRSQSVSLDDGRIKTASFHSGQGFGLRGVEGERMAYAHSAEMSEEAFERASKTVRQVRTGYQGELALPPSLANQQHYPASDPIKQGEISQCVAILQELDRYARAKDPRVVQVAASIGLDWQAVQIIRSGGHRQADIRPLVRVNVSLVVAQNGRRESGFHGCGGRNDVSYWLEPDQWQRQVDEALRQALVNLDSSPAPAGEMPVVLGPGWPGILLHEAIGHGLEGDFNRKKTSAFAGLMGQRIASESVNVVDDGTMGLRRGSLTIDDEGTPSQSTMLIEKGILKSYLQDRQNGRLMGTPSTGNGRRESYAHAPMPRMTNTFMLAGPHDPQEIIASVNKGIYAVNFGGGEVDITNGKFVFSCTEAYMIENGKIGKPLKGATLIGNGPDALTKISMTGNDLRLDEGVGTCGKNGQGVPVGVGQPTLRIDGLTVGGTSLT